MCELATALQLLAVTICKGSINPITIPNPVYSMAISSAALRIKNDCACEISSNLPDPIGWGGMKWLDLAQNRDKRWELLKTVLNLRVP
jgi:hypothetical protein